MGNVLNSFDNMLTSAEDNGQWNTFFAMSILSATTAANTTSGYTTAQRYPGTITVPSVGSNLTGAAFTQIRMINEDAESALICGIEYELGSLAVSSNTFTAGVTMPTKTVAGASLQTAASLMFLVSTSTLTATTPAITITATDQGGAGGATISMTLPSNAIANSAFCVMPHFASGDTGYRAVTNMSKSAGTAGTLKVYGLLPLAVVSSHVATIGGGIDPNTTILPNYVASAGEKIAFYRIGQSTTNQMVAVLNAVADN